MNISRKSLARADWTRILRRRDVHAVIQDAGFDGEAQLIRVDALTAPLVRSYDDGTQVTIVDEGYHWLQLAPREGHWWLTVMFDRDLQLKQYYFDLTAGSELKGSGESCFQDLFLDVVMMPDGRLILLDEDELDAALAQRVIGAETHRLTRERASALMAALEGHEPQLQALCRRYLVLLLEKLAQQEN